jgi:hypothetical protein
MSESAITFKTQKELFDYLHTNKTDLLEMKKATRKTHVFTPSLVESDSEASVSKALTTSSNEDTETMIKRTVIGNTYNWLDSHGDVHVGSTFSKSIGERKNRIWHLHDHEYKLVAKVGTPEKVYEKAIQWSDLGIDKAGSTTALFMDSKIERSKNSQIFEEYKSGNIDQHSVGMYYVKIDLAMNSDDPDHKEYKKTYDQYIDQIGNKEEAEKLGHFYAVKEAKLIEISAVLDGSNSLTPTLGVKNIEPSSDTQDEPAKATQAVQERSKGSIHFY